MRDFEIIPRFFDQKNTTHSKVDTKKVPFSSNYNTYADYRSDLKIVSELCSQDKQVPDELLNKLYATKDELGI
jgi:hypothetical protein